MRLDTFAAPESPPEDVFELFVHVYILSVLLTPLFIFPSSTVCVQHDPGHFFFNSRGGIKASCSSRDPP